MELTISELRANIKTIENDLRSKKTELKSNLYKTVHQTSEGTEITMSDDYDFELNFLEVEELTEKLIKYKSILQDVNSKNMLTDELSLASAIVRVKQLSYLIDDLDYASKIKRKKKRIDGYNNGSYYYEINDLTFNQEEVLNKRNALREEINRLNAMIDNANIKVKVIIA